MLMTSCVVSAAGAMDCSLASDGAPVAVLPNFVDISRKAELQEAWRAHFAYSVAPAVEPARDAATAPATNSSELALDRAREPIARGWPADKDSYTVRARAQTLSSRFAAEPVAGTDVSTSHMPAPMETPLVEPSRAIDPSPSVETLQPHVAALITTTAAPPTATIVAKEATDTAVGADPPRKPSNRTAAAPKMRSVRRAAKTPTGFRLPPGEQFIGPAGRMATDYSNWNAFADTARRR
jgi:hypothetical protein